MPVKQQERFCRDEFDSWLRKRYPDTGIVWQDEANDPPDFWLMLNGQRYAVEVTRIVDEQERGDTAALWQLVERAEKDAQEAGELSGIYVVVFNGRIDKLGKLRNAMTATLRELVRETAALEKFSPTPIEVSGRVLCKVEKHSPHGSVLAPVGGAVDSGSWEGEIREKLSELLQRAFGRKCAIPTKMKVPTIIILYDVYRLASRKTFIECLQAIPQARIFHTLYVVEDLGRGYAAQLGPFPK
jgi:hypothetical protein